jgi:hypothetical protein
MGWRTKELDCWLRYFSSPKLPGRPWGLTNFQSNEYLGLYQMVNGPGCEFDHTPPFSAVKNGGAISTLPYMIIRHSAELRN